MPTRSLIHESTPKRPRRSLQPRVCGLESRVLLATAVKITLNTKTKLVSIIGNEKDNVAIVELKNAGKKVKFTITDVNKRGKTITLAKTVPPPPDTEGPTLTALTFNGSAMTNGSTIVRSGLFEERSRIWSSPDHPEEVYPWRVRIESDLTPTPARAEGEPDERKAPCTGRAPGL